MKKFDLCGAWELYDQNGGLHRGTVPGCVHTDLFAKEVLFWEKNSLDARFIEDQDWKYVKHFEVEKLYSHPELVLEGLDTYCTVTLNGVLLGRTDNMFIPHKFDVEGILKEGNNCLEVQFFSPVKAVADKPKLRGAFTTERLHSRRMQCTYSWDWVDRFVTAGIYRPVYLLFHDGMELEDVYVFTADVDPYSAQIKVKEHFRGFAKGSLVMTQILSPYGEVVCQNESWCEEEEMILHFDIGEPALWYPRPYGEQPLYLLRIIVGDQIYDQKFGIRTVKILQLKDADEKNIRICQELQQTDSGREYDGNESYSGFILLVNGIKIFCSGANWVPCEPFPSAEEDAKITGILEKAVDAGINMIRVWGGGLFEKQHFYEECDRLGILVTQDFLMACGCYPEEEADFREQLRREAFFAAIYLRNHPSLVWWTGDNENAVNGYDGMREYRGRISARKVIAPVLEKLDYNRSFLFSSPYGGKKYASKTVGTTHNTQFLGYILGYLDREDLSDYREYWKEYRARFIAEEPIFGAVGKQSLGKFMGEKVQSDHDMWLYHSKNNPGMGREIMDVFTEFARKLFGDFADWEDQYFKMRYLQYEWVRISMGIARSSMWFNSGIVYWMLNDCWPAAMGWSLLDYYVQEKAGYYALKQFAKPVTVYVEKAEEGYNVQLSSIREKKLKGVPAAEVTVDNENALNLRVYILDLGKKSAKTKLLLEEELYPDAATAEGIVSRKADVTLGRNDILIAELTSAQGCVRNWYKEGCPVLQRTDDIFWEIAGDEIIIRAENYVHVVEIEGAEDLPDNFFSLLPGEKKCIAFRKGAECKISVSGYNFITN